jgi:hypothetical protein
MLKSCGIIPEGVCGSKTMVAYAQDGKLRLTSWLERPCVDGHGVELIAGVEGHGGEAELNAGVPGYELLGSGLFAGAGASGVVDGQEEVLDAKALDTKSSSSSSSVSRCSTSRSASVSSVSSAISADLMPVGRMGGISLELKCFSRGCLGQTATREGGSEAGG